MAKMRPARACKERDGYTCQLCGIARTQTGYPNYLEAHHILPKSRGGTNCLGNLITLCHNCHMAVHELYRMKILTPRTFKTCGILDKKSTWAAMRAMYDV